MHPMVFSEGTGEESLHLVKNKNPYPARSAEKKCDFKQAHMRGEACIGEDSARYVEMKICVFWYPISSKIHRFEKSVKIKIILIISGIGRDSQIEGFQTY